MGAAEGRDCEGESCHSATSGRTAVASVELPHSQGRNAKPEDKTSSAARDSWPDSTASDPCPAPQNGQGASEHGPEEA